VHLASERLLVRELTTADLDAVNAVRGPDLSADARAGEERARWLEWTILGYEQQRLLHQPPYGEYGITLTATGDLIGLVGLVPSLMPFGLLPTYRRSTSPFAVPEVGLYWAVAPAHRRHGYAAEAAARIVGFAFDELKPSRVVATTEHTNTASIGVMRRLGMRIDRNPHPAPFYLQVVGLLDNPGAHPDWPLAPSGDAETGVRPRTHPARRETRTGDSADVRPPRNPRV
jgi:[ribosomal protein S5]-alanine N-acetyltransferase